MVLIGISIELAWVRVTHQPLLAIIFQKQKERIVYSAFITSFTTRLLFSSLDFVTFRVHVIRLLA